MGEPGASIINSTQFAADIGGNANPFFTFSQIWGTSQIPWWTTNISGATLSYSVSNATAFFLIGNLNFDHQTYNVQFKPHDDPSAVKNLQLNDNSRWFTINEVLYWESGLDVARVYDVLITNRGSGFPFFTVYGVVMMDAVGPESASSTTTSSGLPSSTPAALASSTTTPTTGSKVSTSAIAGISLGAIALLVVVSILVVYLFKRRRTKDPNNDIMLDTADTRDSPIIPLGSVSPFTASPSVPLRSKSTAHASPRGDNNSAPPENASRATPVVGSGPQGGTGAPSADGVAGESGARMEVDAGPLVSPPATLPPGYDPLWTEGRSGWVS